MIPEDAGAAVLVHLVRRDAGGVSIRFGDCDTVVTLQASTDPKGVTQVAQSHWIRTPDLARACRPQSFGILAARHALGAAIGDIAFHYHRARRDGHRPDESWFVPAPALAGPDQRRPFSIVPDQ